MVGMTNCRSTARRVAGEARERLTGNATAMHLWHDSREWWRPGPVDMRQGHWAPAFSQVCLGIVTTRLW